MRELLFIRHAAAEDPDDAAREGRGETLRELTGEGVETMHQAARGISRIVEHIDVFLASPLKRAEQTARIVHEHYADAALETPDYLKPGMRFQDLVENLHDRDERVTALVGHEPDFSNAIAAAIGVNRAAFEVKKGSLIALRFENDIVAAAGILKFALPANHLQLLGSRA